MSQKFEKLTTLLKELFQLDQPDLDFGFYRIMHAKSAEVTQFLDHDLLPQVRAAFAQYKPADKAVIEKELAQAIEQAKGLGVDPESTQKVKELRARLANDAVDLDALEAEVYDHLYRFFRRYYSEGDFLSKRVYKEGVYAIPYEGEEVKLYWANYDQYYIKTSEHLRNYAFRLRPEDTKNPMRVHFRLVDAKEGEHGNVKERNHRVFLLAAEDFITEEQGPEGKELVICFEYRPATIEDWPEGQREGKAKPPAQKDLLDLAEQRIFAVNQTGFATWMTELSQPHIKANGEQADHTRLRAHLNRYTARNTFDYFIHKDLGGFLRRELDFYIKNEVMHLDDIESETAPRVEQYLSKIKVIRKIAGKIIDFLAQLEDFQKKLWLKKKFVTETSWCVRLGVIPEEFYAEIAANDAQREEWVRLCAIDKLKPDGGDLFEEGAPEYSEPLTVEFLKAHPTLMVDTRHFDSDFTARLLEAIGDVDEQTDGVLFHSENFQALSLMQARYRERIDCIYIDPPYNTSENTFVYKNNYKHSSWLTMIENRVFSSWPLLHLGGVLECAIDDTELPLVRRFLDDVFGESNRVATLAIEVNPAGQNLRPNTPALSHDYCNIYSRDIEAMQMLLRSLTDEEKKLYTEQDDKGPFLWDNLRRRGGNSRPTDRPGQWFPLYASLADGRVSMTPFEGATEVWPIDPKGEKRIWRVNPAGAARDIAAGEIGVIEKAGRIEIVKKTRIPAGKKPKTLWVDSKYSATTYGTKLLNAVIGQQFFSYPKSLHLVVDCLRYWSDEGSIILDFFAGSGTTGHAVINLNREDGGQRKFILVEMADYFDTVLLPRLKKVTFTPEWKDGKPKRLARAEEAERSPRLFKVIRLESYEDTLNNLDLKRTKTQEDLFSHPEAQGPDRLREQYILRYMLDVETRGSQSLLNIAAFTDPTAYTLKVKRPGSDESREVCVDLIETFNWLIGLTVRHLSAPQSFTAAFKRDVDPDLPLDAPRRLLLDGRLKEIPHPNALATEERYWWFRTVEGETRDGRKTLVIWRNRPGGDTPEGIEQDNLVLDEWFTKQGYSSKDSEFDLIYLRQRHQQPGKPQSP